jgi:hypothetical protein
MARAGCWRLGGRKSVTPAEAGVQPASEAECAHVSDTIPMPAVSGFLASQE